MSTDGPLLVEQRGFVRRLTLNRPAQRNALDTGLIEALDHQVSAAESDPQTRVVAVSGAGRSFCAGGDFRQFLRLHDQGVNPVEFLKDVSACFSRIAASPVPWVAGLHGHAIAGGLELALVCDIVVAADTALIGDGHLAHRLLPAGGASVRLADAVGRGLARRLLLTGELLPASHFEASGWLQAVVREDQLDATVMKFCDAVAVRGSTAQGSLKTLLHEIEGVPVQQALTKELAAFADNWSASAVAEALRSFIDSRTAKVGKDA